MQLITDADVPAVVELINEATPEAPVGAAELQRWLTSPAQDIEFAAFADHWEFSPTAWDEWSHYYERRLG